MMDWIKKNATIVKMETMPQDQNYTCITILWTKQTKAKFQAQFVNNIWSGNCWFLDCNSLIISEKNVIFFNIDLKLDKKMGIIKNRNVQRGFKEFKKDQRAQNNSKMESVLSPKVNNFYKYNTIDWLLRLVSDPAARPGLI